MTLSINDTIKFSNLISNIPVHVLGRNLDFNDQELSKWKTMNETSINKEGTFEMLKTYLDKGGSLERFINALRQSGFDDVANEIEKGSWRESNQGPSGTSNTQQPDQFQPLQSMQPAQPQPAQPQPAQPQPAQPQPAQPQPAQPQPLQSMQPVRPQPLQSMQPDQPQPLQSKQPAQPQPAQPQPLQSLQRPAQPGNDGTIDDETLRKLARRLFTGVDDLASAIGVKYAELKRYKANNYRTGEVTADGTIQMLFDWREKVAPPEQRAKLGQALQKAQLIRIKDEFHL